MNGGGNIGYAGKSDRELLVETYTLIVEMKSDISELKNCDAKTDDRLGEIEKWQAAQDARAVKIGGSAGGLTGTAASIVVAVIAWLAGRL